jgi:Flp pilus assembly protein TadG
MRTTKKRRGSVLVMVAFMLVTLMAMGAIAADNGRFYVVTCELQTAADAAALKGASTLQFSTNANPKVDVDSAVQTFVSTTNRSDGAALGASVDSIKLGFWDPVPNTFTTELNGRRANAVYVALANKPRGTFAQLIGRSTGIDLSRHAIVWIANISLNCTRPWALQYRPLVQAVNGNADTTQNLDPTKFLTYQNLSQSARTLVMHNEQVSGMVPPPDDGVWNAYNLPNGPNGGANSGQTTYQSQILNCNNIAMNSDAGDGNLQPSQGNGSCGAGTIVCWASDVIYGQFTGPSQKQGPGICANYQPGNATCFDSQGNAGVTVDIAFANKIGNGAGGIDFKYVGEVTLLCYFSKSSDVCNAIPNPRPKSNYTQGTLVVVAQGLKSRKLNPTDIASNAPSNVQRLFLVQ